VLKSPPPAVWLTAIAEEGVAFEIRIWINDPEEGLTNVRSDVLKESGGCSSRTASNCPIAPSATSACATPSAARADRRAAPGRDAHLRRQLKLA
jgi:hypothetical protein